MTNDYSNHNLNNKKTTLKFFFDKSQLFFYPNICLYPKNN